MAQLSHHKGGVLVYSGAFSGAAAPVISAGAGSFTVTRTATDDTALVYTVTLRGPLPKGTGMVVTLGILDAMVTGATDKFLVNVKSAVASTGVIVIQARNVAGAAGAADDAAVIHFIVHVTTATNTR